MKEKLFLVLFVIGLCFPYPIIAFLLNHEILLIGTGLAIIGKELSND